MSLLQTQTKVYHDRNSSSLPLAHLCTFYYIKPNLVQLNPSTLTSLEVLHGIIQPNQLLMLTLNTYEMTNVKSSDALSYHILGERAVDHVPFSAFE